MFDQKLDTFLSLRNQSAKHYRHRASPDCNTVASFDSSSSESRNGGLNRYYRQAWENLHESAGSKSGLKAASASAGAPSGVPGVPGAANHSPLRRKETIDEPPYRNGERHRDGSEMVVSDAAAYKGEKKRHHHHHHHHDARVSKAEWRDREPRHNHKRY